MKLLYIGTDAHQAEKVSLAVRLRWPDSNVLVTGEIDESLELVEQEQPDVVMFQPESGDKSIESFIGDLRSYSDVPLIVMEQNGGGAELDEVKAHPTPCATGRRHHSGQVHLIPNRYDRNTDSAFRVSFHRCTRTESLRIRERFRVPYPPAAQAYGWTAWSRKRSRMAIFEIGGTAA